MSAIVSGAMPRPRRFCDDSDEIPGEGLRCRRTDGRKWRCSKRAMNGVTFCEHHYHLTRVNLEKHKGVGQKRDNPSGETPDPPRQRARKGDSLAEAMIAITAARKRRMERKGKEERGERKRQAEARTTRVLPNGLMTIASSPAAHAGGLGDEVFSFDRKIGLEDGRLLTRRCIRSKNAEPIPVGTFKKVPCGRGMGMGRKRACHRCGEKKVTEMVRCSSCRKRFFCSCCITRRYSGISEEEVKIACPVCRGSCDCKTCSYAGATGCKNLASDQNKLKKTKHANNAEMSEEDVKITCPIYSHIEGEAVASQGHANGQSKFTKTECAYNLISQLLPLLKHIYQKQLNELEMKETDPGGRLSGILLEVDEPQNKLVKCNYCRDSVVNFYRSCSRCSCRLCLSCCRKLVKGSYSQTAAIASFEGDEVKKARNSVKEINGKKRVLSTGVRPDNSSFSTGLVSESKENSENSISCPPEFGGCGDGLLKLVFTIPFGWSEYMSKTAEEVAFSSDCAHSLHVNSQSSSLLEDQNIGDLAISLQEVSDR